MSEHEQYAEDLRRTPDALRGEDRARVDEHLAECAACRRELEQLRGDTALLALSTAGPRPPQRARQRLLDALHGSLACRELCKHLPAVHGGEFWDGRLRRRC